MVFGESFVNVVSVKFESWSWFKSLNSFRREKKFRCNYRNAFSPGGLKEFSF